MENSKAFPSTHHTQPGLTKLEWMAGQIAGAKLEQALRQWLYDGYDPKSMDLKQIVFDVADIAQAILDECEKRSQ